MSRYTLSELRALRRGIAAGKSFPQIGQALGRDYKALYRRAVREGWIERSRRYLTPAQVARIRAEYPDMRTADLAAAMGVTTAKLYNAAQRLGLKKSDAFFASDKSARIQRGKQSQGMRATQFKPGHASWNKGRHYAPGGRSAQTQFQPGTRPPNWKPIGSERLSKEGYLERKVTDTGYPPRDWQGVHRLVWAASNGPIPKAHVVTFKPGCRTAVADEITADKLELITLRDNMLRNSLHNYPKPIAKAIQLRGALNRKINRLSKT